jgi:DNA (cytosine-5)-methyltransferase 1
VGRILELFCGIGGLARAVPDGYDVLGIDINRFALEVRELLGSSQGFCRTIESLSVDDLKSICPGTRLWWMSPPCQPFTKQGRRLGLDDSRSAAFINVVRLIDQLLPPRVAMENVPGFSGSDAWKMLVEVLERKGYQWREYEICPTELGGFNRRLRWYLVASRAEALLPLASAGREIHHASGVEIPRLEELPDPSPYLVDESVISRYRDQLHVVTREAFLSGKGTTRCFTSAYGKSPLRSGSCLLDQGSIRHFTPREILWQLGFDPSADPGDGGPRKLWPLVGNSLALRAVRHVLSALALPRDDDTDEG